MQQVIPSVIKDHSHGAEGYATGPELEGHPNDGAVLVQVLERIEGHVFDFGVRVVVVRLLFVQACIHFFQLFLLGRHLVVVVVGWLRLLNSLVETLDEAIGRGVRIYAKFLQSATAEGQPRVNHSYALPCVH